MICPDLASRVRLPPTITGSRLLFVTFPTWTSVIKLCDYAPMNELFLESTHVVIRVHNNFVFSKLIGDLTCNG